MNGWRAWHWDGTETRVFDSSETTWQALPPEGIVGVVEYLDPPYRRIHDGHDWIWIEGGEFLSTPTHDEWGQWAERPEVPCGACVKRGAGVPDDRWAEIQSEMMEARECP